MARHQLRALTAAAALLAACGSDLDEREAAASAARSVSLGRGVSVRVAGATVREAPTDAAPDRVEVRAQSLDVRVEVEAAHCEPRTLEVVVTPVPASMRLSQRPFLAAISTGAEAAREAAGAGVDFSADRDDPDWTPIDAETPTDCAAEGNALVFTLRLNPKGPRTYRVECGPAQGPPQDETGVACLDTGTTAAGELARAPLLVRHRARAALPTDAPFTFAVIANNAGNGGRRDAFVAAMASRAAELGVRFVVVNGDLTSGGEVEQLEEARRAYDALPVPWYATVGERDVDDAEPDEIVEAIGATTFAFDAGPARVIVLDSAEAGLSPTTHDLLEGYLEGGTLWWRTGASRPKGYVVLTHFPPFEPAPLGNNAFKSRREAARFLAQLRRGEVPKLITGHLGIYDVQTVAGVDVVHSGGGGAPMETVSDDGHHWLLVSVALGCDGVCVEVTPQPL
jgi:hypothetical protein